MSREIEKFHNSPDYYPGFERWVDPPPGLQCIKCGADMFLHANGVTYICSECTASEQKGEREQAKYKAAPFTYGSGFNDGFEKGFTAGIEYEKDRRSRAER